MKRNIALVCGGFSSEYEVSLNSAFHIIDALGSDVYNVYRIEISKDNWLVKAEREYVINKNDFSFVDEFGYKHFFEVVLNVIHGTPGEDGKLAAYFDMLNIPYTSGSVLNSALTFDKYYCNEYMRHFNVLTPTNYLFRRGDKPDTQKIVEKVGLPCFVKPNNGGSSCGTTKVKKEKQLSHAVELALHEDKEVIIEEYIEGTEVTCGIFKSKNKNIVFPLTEIVSKNEFFDYESKYDPTMADEITPARISKKLTEECKKISSEIYTILNCKGLVRLDFILKNNRFYFLEVNTVPGLTKNSILPKMIKEYGISFKDVLIDMIESVFE